jgi:hypothetical protein
MWNENKKPTTPVGEWVLCSGCSSVLSVRSTTLAPMTTGQTATGVAIHVPVESAVELHAFSMDESASFVN